MIDIIWTSWYYKLMTLVWLIDTGDVAQMAERPLSMREVRGSIPCFSKLFNSSFIQTDMDRVF